MGGHHGTFICSWQALAASRAAWETLATSRGAEAHSCTGLSPGGGHGGSGESLEVEAHVALWPLGLGKVPRGGRRALRETGPCACGCRRRSA